ncbi:protein SGT1 homolog B isoform X1 [Brassica napus]|uniref:protein SGT1 homolog B isoform X1 n=1 Tax=Brassica napus TaxID=3708 RepID=UPI0020787690|nr:protein SGT1 homolog B isoform X1 [Brassica napus]
MAKELAEKAKEAFLDDDFDVAVDLYSKAIDLDPSCASFFADRAQANIKLLNFTEAVADANKAIELEPTLAKAYLRKGTACMKLEEYATAKAALEKGASVAPNESKFEKMIDECNLLIAEEEKDLVQQVPPTLPSSSTTPLATAADAPPVPSPAPPAKPMFRHEFYQKPEEVVVTIFAKGIPKQNVNVEFGDQILSVVIDVAGEEAYHFQPRLFGKIIPEKCRYEVLSTKVEIRLAKAEIVTWASLEYGKGQALLPKPNVASAVSQRPVYPSSKPGKDWDKLEAEVKKQVPLLAPQAWLYFISYYFCLSLLNVQEKDEKLDGDAAMNKFFSDIYQSADEDMRRAMNKSFAESNGTVLSTNWKEVGTKKVESTPPDGMELKKWEY